MSGLVLYAEVPGFYACVERALDPGLAERPVIVGGDPRRRGVVQDATADAIAAGVTVGMPMQDALQRCPRARALRTNMPRYREASLRLRASLRQLVERLEPEGLGAAYLDLEGRGDTPEAARELGVKLRDAVQSEPGLPLRVGIAGNKLIARLAAEESGEGGVRLVAPGAEEAFLFPLPATRLPGVGRHAAATLAQLGARTIGELAALGRGRLEAALGNRGLELHELARGQGSTTIRAERFPGSLSQEETLDASETDPAVLARRLAELARRLEAALRLQGIAARRIALKVRFDDGETISRSQTLAHAVADRDGIEGLAVALLSRADAGQRPIRLLGITLQSFTRLRRDDRQLDLFSR